VSVDTSFVPADRPVVVVPVMQVPDLGYLMVDRRTGELDTSDPTRTLHVNDREPLEMARRLKGDGEEEPFVVAMAVDREGATGGLHEALAWGADAAVLLAAPGVAAEPVARANLFAQAVRTLPRVDLVVVGTETMEPDWSLVGGALAGILDWPLVPGARGLSLNTDSLRGFAMFGAVWEGFESQAPAVVTVRPGTLRPRWPTTWGLADAYAEDAVHSWGLGELDTDGRLLSRLVTPSETRNLKVVRPKTREPERFTDPPEVSARTLGKRLARQGYLGGF
jgi:electron transfer flavoprotein alpha/beta subunit